MSYSPSGSDRTRYRPASSVTLLRIAPVSRFFVFTAADGTGAPEGSVTVPLMLGDYWARADGKQTNRKKRASDAARCRVQLDRLARRKKLARESSPIANGSFLFILESPVNAESGPQVAKSPLLTSRRLANP